MSFSEANAELVKKALTSTSIRTPRVSKAEIVIGLVNFCAVFAARASKTPGAPTPLEAESQLADWIEKSAAEIITLFGDDISAAGAGNELTEQHFNDARKGACARVQNRVKIEVDKLARRYQITSDEIISGAGGALAIVAASLGGDDPETSVAMASRHFRSHFRVLTVRSIT